MTAASPSHEGSEPDNAEIAASAPDEDGQIDVKAKFREALARKRGVQADAAAALAANPDAAKVRGTQGPAARQRSFRRKSGG